ncbi:MAG TPA: alpha/beta fold hydrolase [Stackebrandtia sp.]|jgi:surfactin synthase thioesterase subunit|uniref:thioesterase II family protein n=1 Tax=Stackebrandtia sp. TaxID=2023065 RepID=UPI002D5396F1|nr:alpha/beta fold hydrolase [Stackebrandtia sp.]HZE39140.1 alpha/beta fold hydrolase [Stackebrandtia sp.]
MTPPKTPWLVNRQPRPGARLRLYCFPHSGGSAGEYARWDEGLSDVEVWGVQLPGRGHRAAAPASRRMDDLIARLLGEVEFRPPFALFGHSLGALIAYETAHALRAQGRPSPVHVAASAYPAPHLTRLQEREPLHKMDDARLEPLVLEGYGALADELASDPEYLGLVIAGHRADYEVFETYRFVEREPLDVPMMILGGLDDDIGAPELAGWRGHTRAGFGVHLLPGGHFYLRDERAAVLRLIGSIPPDVPSTPGATR